MKTLSKSAIGQVMAAVLLSCTASTASSALLTYDFGAMSAVNAPTFTEGGVGLTVTALDGPGTNNVTGTVNGLGVRTNPASGWMGSDASENEALKFVFDATVAFNSVTFTQQQDGSAVTSDLIDEIKAIWSGGSADGFFEQIQTTNASKSTVTWDLTSLSIPDGTMLTFEHFGYGPDTIAGDLGVRILQIKVDTVTTPPGPGTVPVPAPLLLMGSGLALLGFFSGRRRRITR